MLFLVILWGKSAQLCCRKISKIDMYEQEQSNFDTKDRRIKKVLNTVYSIQTSCPKICKQNCQVYRKINQSKILQHFSYPGYLQRKLSNTRSSVHGDSALKKEKKRDRAKLLFLFCANIVSQSIILFTQLNRFLLHCCRFPKTFTLHHSVKYK